MNLYMTPYEIDYALLGFVLGLLVAWIWRKTE